MLRFIARSIGVLVVLVPLAAAAQLPIPAGVNLHNGYIEVINHVVYQDGFSYPGDVRLNETPEGKVGSGGTLLVNRCCILAGSHYVVELNYVTTAGQRSPFGVTPRLCNIRGIPFGYAVVEYTGTLKKAREGSGSPTRFEMFNFRGHRLDETCPVER